MACLSSRHVAVQAKAAALLRVLTVDSSELCAALVAARGVPALVQLLHSHDGSALAAGIATLCNVSIAGDAEVCAALLSAGALEPIGRLLLCTDSDNQMFCLATIQLLLPSS